MKMYLCFFPIINLDKFIGHEILVRFSPMGQVHLKWTPPMTNGGLIIDKHYLNDEFDS